MAAGKEMEVLTGKVLLSAKHILDADDLPTMDVEVPEWGGWVRLRGLTGKQRDELEKSTIKQRGGDVQANFVNFRARIVAASAIDESGQLLFGQDEVAALGRKSSRVLDKLAEACSRLSGMSADDVEELVAGFDKARSEDSTSG